MQSEFVPLVEEAAAECINYFKDRLCAFYLHGSIAFNEAIPNVSDMDSYIVVSGDINDKDKKHFIDTEVWLQKKYPVVNGVHLNIHSQEELKGDKFARFILRYNSVLYYGEDIVKRVEENGCERMLPNTETAKSRLSFAKQCFSEALNGKQPANTGEIPTDPYYASRKFAKYFVIIEGAYFLMSENRFSSFENEAVICELRKLQSSSSEFENILDVTEKVLYNPLEAKVSANEYLKIIQPFVEYIFDKTEYGK